MRTAGNSTHFNRIDSFPLVVWIKLKLAVECWPGSAIFFRCMLIHAVQRITNKSSREIAFQDLLVPIECFIIYSSSKYIIICIFIFLFSIIHNVDRSNMFKHQVLRRCSTRTTPSHSPLRRSAICLGTCFHKCYLLLLLQDCCSAF